MAMTLAIFDLDNTLIGGDSDYLWGNYLVAAGLVDKDFYERENARFYEEYRQGTLNIYEFLDFSLRPLADNPPDTLFKLRDRFMAEIITPIILPAALALIDEHRRQGHLPVIVSATNRFVTEPIARSFGVDQLLATDPEIIDGRYTGRVTGTPTFREGKVTRVHQWLGELGQRWEAFERITFYSDSTNDLPLLERVHQPVATNPGAALEQIARERGWRILKLFK